MPFSNNSTEWHVPRRALLTGLTGAAATLLWPPAGRGAEPSEPQEPGAGAEGAKKALFSGRVLRLGDALRAREIRFRSEMEDHIVLETDSQELIPILADWRGRAFYQDERLRERRVDLVGFRREGLPYLQVLMIFCSDDGERSYVDYWCDICSIPMYEIKPCDCCQGEIRLRLTPQELPEEFRHRGTGSR